MSKLNNVLELFKKAKLRTWRQLKQDRFIKNPEEALEYIKAVAEEENITAASIAEVVATLAPLIKEEEE